MFLCVSKRIFRLAKIFLTYKLFFISIALPSHSIGIFAVFITFFHMLFICMIFNTIWLFVLLGIFIAYILLETICKDVKYTMATMLEQIETVLDNYVRPSLASHQGDVVIVDYTNDVLRVRLTGKCSGCPSAQLTTEELISATVKEHIPQVNDVILVSGVSDELIAQAKALLHNHHL